MTTIPAHPVLPFIEFQSKICQHCNTLKPYTSFYKRTMSGDGYDCKCIDCAKAYKIQLYQKWKDNPKQIDGKFCSVCNNWKPLHQFYNHIIMKDGHRTDCMECCKSAVSTYWYEHVKSDKSKLAHRYALNSIWRHSNRDRLNIGHRKYYSIHIERIKQYRLLHKEKRQTQRRQWYKNNLTHCKMYKLSRKEIEAEQYKVRFQRDPEPYRLYRRLAMNRRRANMQGTIKRAEWIALCNAFGNVCLCCGKKTKLTLDHVLPVSKGGLNVIDNCQPLCMRCNVQKYNRHIDYRAKAPNFLASEM